MEFACGVVDLSFSFFRMPLQQAHHSHLACPGVLEPCPCEVALVLLTVACSGPCRRCRSRPPPLLAVQHPAVVALLHGEPNPVQHEPRGLSGDVDGARRQLVAANPVLAVQTCQTASSQDFRGIGESSKIVPTLTENCRLACFSGTQTAGQCDPGGWVRCRSGSQRHPATASAPCRRGSCPDWQKTQWRPATSSACPSQ